VFRKTPELLHYWLQIYLSYATTGTHINVRYWPSTPDEVLAFEDVARAMEIFVVAHEYGHHHYQHGRAVEADSHMEEFEADQFALRISGVLAGHRTALRNPYLESGAGGVVMLMALDTLRAVEHALGFSEQGGSDTHPELSLRVGKFDNIALLQPDEFMRLKRTGDDPRSRTNRAFDPADVGGGLTKVGGASPDELSTEAESVGRLIRKLHKWSQFTH
jgi:hypothetical protein